MPLRGDFMMLTLKQTQRKYACSPSPQQGAFHLVDIQVIPERVKPGEEVNHIIQYALCSSSNSATMKGRITRIVYFQGKEVARDHTQDYEFKPGSWAFGRLLGVPKNAKNGAYAIHTTVSYQRQNEVRNSTFYVDHSLKKY
jgi:hypothetical protein